MQTIELKATRRENLGKTSTKQLRREDQVPCVLYGGKEILHFSVLEKEFNKLIYTPETNLVKINLDGKSYPGIVQECQFHPVTNRTIHVDFLQVFDDKPIVVEIPVKLKGLAAGVKAGGKLALELRKIKVKALAKNLPETLSVDVTRLELNKSIKVGDLDLGNIDLLNPKNQVVASVKLTRAARAAGLKEEEVV